MELDSFSLAVDETRAAYRRAIEICKDGMQQADSLGTANPDASLVRAHAVEQLKTATEKYAEALSALSDAVIRYRPR